MSDLFPVLVVYMEVRLSSYPKNIRIIIIQH